ncbi:PREDICTED: protein FANTASTIC FOUR 3-like [Ipomoea nil]|uniref:protein FANTASTIC FOUR 3-like n=1 Tax=Ipomoea nil TaxID=35883 RepID=UPI0009018707|nr:PREDICTED: protein FANTASTIC FOUR 3-like [Ipomoea nil]
MSTIAYNQDNLLSCLESQIIETATLKLKLSSPRCIDLGGWGFLQSLPNTSMEKGKQPTYVHPLSKQFSSYSCSKLSETSLKLCTENLGSETGTDIAETAIFSSDSLPESSALPPLPRQVAAPRNRNKVKGKPKNFPPPLTTLSAPNSLQVRSRREGGRLIIVAVEAPPKHAYFQAERSHGRLRLSFCSDSAKTNGEVDGTCRDITIEDEEEEERDMDGNILEAEVEMGMEKYQTLRRCMESGHRNKALCDLKPLCVATS